MVGRARVHSALRRLAEPLAHILPVRHREGLVERRIHCGFGEAEGLRAPPNASRLPNSPSGATNKAAMFMRRSETWSSGYCGFGEGEGLRAPPNASRLPNSHSRDRESRGIP